MKRFAGLGWRGFRVLSVRAVDAGDGPWRRVAPNSAPAIQSVLDCRKIDDGPERLACFDKAVMAMEQGAGDWRSGHRRSRAASSRAPPSLRADPAEPVVSGSWREA